MLTKRCLCAIIKKMKERVVLIMCKTMNNEINEAISEVEVAQKQFDFAEKEFVDVAIMKLSYAISKLNLLVKLSKMNY